MTIYFASDLILLAVINQKGVRLLSRLSGKIYYGPQMHVFTCKADLYSYEWPENKAGTVFRK